MKIRSSARLLAGGLFAGIAGAILAAYHHTQDGVTYHPAFIAGALLGGLGVILFVAGIYQFARNVDLAAAKYVDGPDAVIRLTQPRDVRKRVDIDG